MISGGSSFAEVQNFYDENLGTIRIPMDPALTPAANASKYFKEYKKSYNAEQTLSELVNKDSVEIEYLKKSRLVLKMRIIEEYETIKEALEQKQNIQQFRKVFRHYF